MITRTWSARATEAGARDYHTYFDQTLLPELRKLAGFGGAYLLSRDHDDIVELTVHTFWDSFDAITSFAGETFTVAVVEPEAQAMLLEIDPTVSHRTVLVDRRPSRE
ncbi:hypothetical protein [Fodinicola feengrottensis]|uniref:Antibiotic biosynthesis monooxygenase n=1 Tax=Fodinicola feengrottensis TaxID=435914 RepID=A0ABN2G6U5_9ACTN|nr:hypothetical protein [Fodinicola feengrottensis]